MAKKPKLNLTREQSTMYCKEFTNLVVRHNEDLDALREKYLKIAEQNKEKVDA